MTGDLLPLPEVDPTKCVSYGLCHDHAAKYLEMQDDGITRVRPGLAGVDPQDAADVAAAVRACPAQAISWSVT